MKEVCFLRFPRLIIHTERIKYNAELITKLTQKHGISLTGVTKGACGNVAVAKAMIEGGVSSLADSRLVNLHKLRNYFGQDLSLLLLRLPALSDIEQVVEVADVSLNSEFEIIEALDRAAMQRGKKHGVILMIDLGDLREGIWPDQAIEITSKICKLKHVFLQGIGTNLTCYGGVLPTQNNLNQLVEIANEVQKKCTYQLCYISGGNSSSLYLLQEGKMPPDINHLRVGETILIGQDPALFKPFPQARRDTFTLQAELIEMKIKPSVPIGIVGRDAFGRIPAKATDKGKRLRGILAIGEQDINTDGLRPQAKGVEVLGASSDHLLIDLTDYEDEIKLGDYLSFDINYSNLLKTMTSPFVEKVVL